MEIITEAIKGLSVAAIIGSVVLFLAPSGATEKSVKTIVSVFLISCLVLPFASESRDFEFSPDLPEADAFENENNITKTAGEQLKKELENQIISSLLSIDIKPVQVNIDIKISDKDLAVESVQVVLKKEDYHRKEEIKKRLDDEIGINATVLEDKNENQGG